MDMAAATTVGCIVSESSMVPTDMAWCLGAGSAAAVSVEVVEFAEVVDSAEVAGPRAAAVAVAVKE
jgi:hypothetical protein